MSNWINSGGHAPRQLGDAYLRTNPAIPESTRWKLPLRITCALLLAALISPSTHAHDHEHPELNSWYQSLHSGKGPCCDGSDAVRIADPDWETANGHYRVRIEGEWIDVPDEAVITEPNRIGRTMVWPIKGYLGVTIRCFMPGSMT